MSQRRFPIEGDLEDYEKKTIKVLFHNSSYVDYRNSYGSDSKILLVQIRPRKECPNYCSVRNDRSLLIKAVAFTDEILVRLNDGLKCIEDHDNGLSVTNCKCPIGEPHNNYNPNYNRCAQLMDDYGQVLLKYHCHICYKKILKSMLLAIVSKPPKKDTSVFVAQVLQNLYLNRETFDVEIVAECMRILQLLELPQVEIVKLISSKLKLSSITSKVLSHYAKLWRPVSGECLKLILRALKVTFLESQRRMSGFLEKHREVLIESLAIFFYLDRNKMPFAHRIVVSLTKMKTKAAWEFLSNYMEKLHTSIKWKSNYVTARQYLRQFTVNYVENLIIWKDSARNARNEFKQIVRMLLDLIRTVHIRHNHDSCSTFVERVLLFKRINRLQELPRDLYVDVVEVLCLKVQEALAVERRRMTHDRVTIPDGLTEFPSQLKNSSSAANETSATKQFNHLDVVVESVLEKIYKWFGLMHVDQTFAEKSTTLDFLNVLVRSARFRISTMQQAYAFKSMLPNIQKIITFYGSETMLKSGIAQTIFTNINCLHYNCKVCDTLGSAFYIMLSILKPIAIVDFRTDEYGIELATSLPYVVHNKKELIPHMYPVGFTLFTVGLEQHRRGIIESLYLLSEILRQTNANPTDPDQCKLQACQTELNEPDKPDTKIFVLDDGTKIECRIAPLVQNSSYFWSLLNGTFAEAVKEEIRIREVSAFQFSFMVNFIASKSKEKFELDIQTHLDLLIFCNRFLLDGLSEHLANSLLSQLTPKILPDIYEVALYYGCIFLRRMCMDFTLGGDLHGDLRMRLLQYLFYYFDNKAFADDVREWIFRKSRPEGE